MMWLLRMLLIALILFLIYSVFKFALNPKRKLEFALEKKQFFLLDDRKNVHKNFLLTYKGVVFEGEKYLGTTENTFEVVSIFIWPHNASALNGLAKEDFRYIETELAESYPNAKVDWKSPIYEFMNK